MHRFNGFAELDGVDFFNYEWAVTWSGLEKAPRREAIALQAEGEDYIGFAVEMATWDKLKFPSQLIVFICQQESLFLLVLGQAICKEGH